VRAAGGGDWVALGAAGLMAADNLLLVHSRIATLDVPVLATMLWGAVLYLRGDPIMAGALIGIGTCIKLVAPYALLVLALVELLRRLTRRCEAVSPARVAARLGGCVGTAAAVFVGLLAVLDRVAPPYDSAKAKLLASGPFHHIAHMLSYGANQTSPHGPTGIASDPWDWLVDFKPIVYLNVNPARPSAELYDVHPAVHFLGMISPPIMLLGVPALALGGWRLISGRRRRVARSGEPVAQPSGGVLNLAVAWFIGTFVPFLLLSLLLHRTSYLYYIVVVMPGIYLAAADLAYRARRYRKLLALWVLLVLAAAVVMYPFTPLP
jgi:dolichyl-phosphate-mannose--protein O-mannosyl transferase